MLRVALGVAAFCFVLAATDTPAALQRESAWDVTAPRGVPRTIDFTTDQGTWMSTDVSPDGRWIVFDLLGHVYRLPIAGGAAELLTGSSGIALNFHPRYSPDGRYIAFISDRAGQNNLWIMNADGSGARAVYRDDAVCVVEPVWLSDGSAIVVRRQRNCHRGNWASSGLWSYSVAGGQPREVVKESEQAAGWPSVSPDGAWLYYHYAACPGYHAGRNDLLRGCMQIRRVHLRSGEIENVTQGESFTSQWSRDSNGSALAPSISPDGRWMAFARRIPDGTISFKGHKYGPRNALWLRDLERGAERVVMDPIETDLAHGLPYAMHLLPTYSWTRDSTTIVLSQGGRIRRLRVSDGTVQTIPFRARVHRQISQSTHVSRRAPSGPVTSRFIRWPATAPDGASVAFEAFGQLWTSTAAGTAPLLRDHKLGLELSPSWSPDGRWIAFATWAEGVGGHIWRVRSDGSSPPERVTKQPGEYLNPAWADEGTLVFARGSGATVRGKSWSDNAYYDIVSMSGSGGDERSLARVQDQQLGQVVRPSIAQGRVYFVNQRRRERSPSLLESVRLDGSDRREHIRFQSADDAAVSADGSSVAFIEGALVHVAQLPVGTAAPTKDGADAKSVVVSPEGGLYPRWRNARQLEFVSGATLYTYDAAERRSSARKLDAQLPRYIGRGRLAFTNARVLTMQKDTVLSGATIVIDGDRITCVGRCDAAGVTRTIDLAGATVMPGIVDTHAHRHVQHQGIIPPHNYEAAAYMAYGITSTIDPAPSSFNLFPAAETVEAGLAVGPRSYGTAEVLVSAPTTYGAVVDSLEAADREVRRRAAWGAISLKDFLVSTRRQRQWIAEAARRHGLLLTGEGGSLEHDLSMVMDGHSGWEHDLTYTPVYDDVARFFGQARAIYSITLMTDGPGPLNEEFFWQQQDVWRDEKQREWLPWAMFLPHTRTRWLRPETDYTYPILAQGLVDIVERGGYGTVGGHGDQHGLGTHWEIWMLAEAAGNLRALQFATTHGAHALGLDEDLGSVAAGRLADLIVLEKDPVLDIRNTTSLRYVMKAGVLYDAATLDEISPASRPFGPRWWKDPSMLTADDRSTSYWDRESR